MPVTTRSQSKAKTDAIKAKMEADKKWEIKCIHGFIKKPIEYAEDFDYHNLLQCCKQGSFEKIRIDHLRECNKFHLYTITRVLDYMIDKHAYYDYPCYNLLDEDFEKAVNFQRYVTAAMLEKNL